MEWSWPLSDPYLTPIWPLSDPYLIPIWPLSSGCDIHYFYCGDQSHTSHWTERLAKGRYQKNRRHGQGDANLQFMVCSFGLISIKHIGIASGLFCRSWTGLWWVYHLPDRRLKWVRSSKSWEGGQEGRTSWSWWRRWFWCIHHLCWRTTEWVRYSESYRRDEERRCSGSW